MDVAMSGATTARRNRWAKVGISLAFMAVVIAPAFAWPLWARLLSTLLFVLLGLIVGRASRGPLRPSRTPKEPPAKPLHMPWPTVSVLVPAFNEAQVLPRS